MRAIKEPEAEKRQAARDTELRDTVEAILSGVRSGGEKALLEYTERFDRVKFDTVAVSRERIEEAWRLVPEKTAEALRFSRGRIRAFAEKQLESLKSLSWTDPAIPGLGLALRLEPVETAACYVPAGRYPLPSSALMSITVAKAAGVKKVLACSPPVSGLPPVSGSAPVNNPAGAAGIHPAVLVAMDIAGADAVFCMGGAQAVAAFAYGAGPVEKCDLIVGPGNRYVTEAKRQIAGIAGIDGLAGPSEVLIIADGTANPRWLALDLMAQAEHDADARCILACTSGPVIEETLREIGRLLETLPTRETAARAWQRNGEVWLAESLEEAAAFSSTVAPEHLELQVDPAREAEIAGSLVNAASLFVGHHAPVALGDFVTGTNHILPTMGNARFSSGLWAGTFLRASFRQDVSKEAFDALAGPALLLAELEGLAAHHGSVRART